MADPRDLPEGTAIRRTAARGRARLTPDGTVKLADHPGETRQPAISATMRGILATHGKPARPAAALTSAEVKRLLVSFAGALRRLLAYGPVT